MIRLSRWRWCSRTYAGARSGSPISSAILMTDSAAPPCSGPFSVPMAVTLAGGGAQRRGGDPGGERRGVGAVLGVEDEVEVHRVHGLGGRFASLEHVEEAGGVAQVFARRQRRPPPAGAGSGGAGGRPPPGSWRGRRGRGSSSRGRGERPPRRR